MSALERGWRRLGAVLVEAGLITEDDLIEALAVQEHSDRPLGEILVARGLVSAPAVANALAEQRGSFFKSEHGFGTGLRSSINRDSDSAGETSDPEAPPLSDLPAATQSEDEPVDAVDRAQDDELHVTTRTAVTPQGQQESAESGPGPPSTAEHSENALEAEARPPESEHLLFVPTPHGYLLLEQSGAVPNVGEVLELPEVPGGRAIVAKVASSPLPGDRKACAYLQPQ
jgi:hypothetical protein